MVKFKRIGVLVVSAIITAASVLSVSAGEDGGTIKKNGTENVGGWNNYFVGNEARASTYEKEGLTHYKNTYMTVNVQSRYPNGGSHAYYVNKTVDAGKAGSTDAKGNTNAAYAKQKIADSEYGLSAYTKHIIIIDGTAYTPDYAGGTSKVVKP